MFCFQFSFLFYLVHFKDDFASPEPLEQQFIQLADECFYLGARLDIDGVYIDTMVGHGSIGAGHKWVASTGQFVLPVPASA